MSSVPSCEPLNRIHAVDQRGNVVVVPRLDTGSKLLLLMFQLHFFQQYVVSDTVPHQQIHRGLLLSYPGVLCGCCGSACSEATALCCILQVLYSYATQQSPQGALFFARPSTVAVTSTQCKEGSYCHWASP